MEARCDRGHEKATCTQLYVAKGKSGAIVHLVSNGGGDNALVVVVERHLARCVEQSKSVGDGKSTREVKKEDTMSGVSGDLQAARFYGT